MTAVVKGGVMGKALTVGVLLFSLGAGAVAGTWGGSWSFVSEWTVDPFDISNLDSLLKLWYSPDGLTFASTAVFGLSGLENVYFEAEGTLGLLALRSFLDFDATAAEFRTGLVSLATAIAGLNVYGLFMLDDVNPSGSPALGTGITIGMWQETDEFSFWAAARFNMTDTLTYIYRYGYEWLLDHFIFQICDVWVKPSGYIDVQTASCSLSFTGFEAYLELPMDCFTLLTQLSLTCDLGFNYLLFEIKDVDLGFPISLIRWIDVLFTVDSKAVTIVFDIPAAEEGCLTPYFAFETSPTNSTLIEGIGLKAVLLKYEWNGITLKAGHLFDEDGWYPYPNYFGTRIYGWTWEGELATNPICVVTRGYDEFFGIQVGGPACCGGTYGFSAFAWFDTGNSSGIFDWVETRITLRTAIGSNADLFWGLSVTTSGVNWVRLGVSSSW